MRGALTHRLAGASRKALTCVLAASVLLAAPTPALAGVEGEMQNFMSEMGVQGNVTGPSAYQGQSAGYYSGGAVWSRFPQKNIQSTSSRRTARRRAAARPVCRLFSFINTAELVAMLKAIANNAPFAFPKLGSTRSRPRSARSWMSSPRRCSR